MTLSPVLLALPEALRRHGITVVEMPGWRSRDTADGRFQPLGIIDHHDGVGSDTTNVAVNMTRPGNNGAQLWVRRNGDVHMLAAGRMWHAGSGSGYGDIAADSGNMLAVGIETDYPGAGPWPPALLASWRVLRRELAVGLGITPGLVNRRLCGHKEYAPGRKTDPANLDMNLIRAQLAADLVSPRPVPPVAPVTKEWFEMATKQDLIDALRESGAVSGPRLMKIGKSADVWLVSIDAHTKWHVPSMDQVDWLHAVGIQWVSGPQAPWTIADYRDVSSTPIAEMLEIMPRGSTAGLYVGDVIASIHETVTQIANRLAPPTTAAKS